MEVMLVPLSETDATIGEPNTSNEMPKSQRLSTSSLNQRSGVTIGPSC